MGTFWIEFAQLWPVRHPQFANLKLKEVRKLLEQSRKGSKVVERWRSFPVNFFTRKDIYFGSGSAQFPYSRLWIFFLSLWNLSCWHAHYSWSSFQMHKFGRKMEVSYTFLTKGFVEMSSLRGREKRYMGRLFELTIHVSYKKLRNYHHFQLYTGNRSFSENLGNDSAHMLADKHYEAFW